MDLLAHIGYAAVYAAVGLVMLVAGFYVLDLLTPGRLGHLIAERNRGASVIAAVWSVVIGAIVFVAIWTNGASGFGSALGWSVAFGVVGIALQAVAFVLADLLTPGRLGEIVVDLPAGGAASGQRPVAGTTAHPAVWFVAGVQIAVGLVVVASIA